MKLLRIPKTLSILTLLSLIVSDLLLLKNKEYIYREKLFDSKKICPRLDAWGCVVPQDDDSFKGCDYRETARGKGYYIDLSTEGGVCQGEYSPCNFPRPPR
jgi:hypothetical protein